ncbi:MAG: S41 family peptidase [Vulcanimicrobiota bacterium]
MRFLLLLLLLHPVQDTLVERVWSLVASGFYRANDFERFRQEASEAVEGLDGEQRVKVVNDYLARLEASHTHLYSAREPAYYELLDVFAYGPQAEAITALFGGELPHYEGIGVVTREGVVWDVVPGGPGHQLQRGDRIVSVDGQPFHPIDSFRGRAGKACRLTIEKRGDALELEVVPQDIQPRRFFLQAIRASARMQEHEGRRLAYVRMWSYAGEAYQEELRAVLEGPLAGAEGLVLDLRGSWGGAQPKYMELFAATPSLTMTSPEGEKFDLPGSTWNRPVVVLIDGSVSSGKELLAHAFKRSRRGLLVGEKTRGAVLGGGLHLLPDGHALYLAQADVRVDGERLEGVGVAPDVEVGWNEGPDPLPEAGFRELLKVLQKEKRPGMAVPRQLLE